MEILAIYISFMIMFHVFIDTVFQFLWLRGAVVGMWYLDIQLPVQSVPITTKVVSSNPVHG
jgi:hypothetical protein